MINGFEIGELYVLNRQTMLFTRSDGIDFKKLYEGDVVVFLGKKMHNADFNEFEYRFMTKHGMLCRLFETGDCDEWFEKL